MKLIDADELIEWVKYWIRMDHYYNPDTLNDIPISELEDIIERMPTAEAIPVEWLNQYAVAVNHDSIKDITRTNVVNELIDTYLSEKSVQNDTNGRLANEKKGNKSICESCDNISCIYQSGIYREKCDFYEGKTPLPYCIEDGYRHLGCTYPMCDMTCPVHQQQIKDKLESIGLGKKNENW